MRLYMTTLPTHLNYSSNRIFMELKFVVCDVFLYQKLPCFFLNF